MQNSTLNNPFVVVSFSFYASCLFCVFFLSCICAFSFVVCVFEDWIRCRRRRHHHHYSMLCRCHGLLVTMDISPLDRKRQEVRTLLSEFLQRDFHQLVQYSRRS